MRVDFLVAGAQKSGTTALDAYLRQHRQIAMAGRKELHFFDDDASFIDPGPDYGPYHAAFQAPCEAAVLFGESTPSYLYWPPAPERIRRYNPGMKFLILLRDPVERAYSHWNMQRLRNLEKASFGEAIRNEPSRLQGAAARERRRFSYVDRGLYAEQLERLWASFPPDQALVLRSEDLRRHPEQILRQSCAFLGIAPPAPLEPLQRHARDYAAPMPPEDREFLVERYRPSVRKLERLLGWNCSDWLAGSPAGG